ncbi:hypothetical protein, partial [Burkholderia multivorans]|uniref:hypothetical protein n=1 Tax=Burkholderia multivorans TaxID=87883 RepID=UPI0019D19D8E
NSYVNLKIATCLVRYADDRLIDQRFLSDRPSASSKATTKRNACSKVSGIRTRHTGLAIICSREKF